LEAALKLKEISYIQTEGFAAGELKHGTIALIEEGTPVIALISQKRINHNTRANIREVLSRGAEVIVISLTDVSESADQVILMDVHEMLSPLLMVIPTQLIAFYSALHLNRDIDKPRNLAKSVTVE
jgi:glucosamine--fructose-6-phosphate aminotransferase (isomerizing)